MTSTAGVNVDVDLDHLDLFSDEVLTDSQPIYDQLRETAPVVHLPVNDVWAITRYNDVRDALGDPATFSSTQVAFNPTMNEILVGSTLATDPPNHKQLRTALMEGLTPRALRDLKGTIERKADDLVGELAQRGSFDGMVELARAFPISIVMDLIGVQGDVRNKILGWGEAAFNLLGPLNERAVAGFPTAGELFEWTHDHIKADDLAEGSIGRGIFAAADRGDIPPEACGMIIHQYLAAGMDTTITSLGNALVLFGAHPEQYRLLHEDPSRAGAAFAEVQRFKAPMPLTGRRAMRDVEIGGTVIPAGAQVAVIMAAANHDPRHYDDPGTFDIGRNPVDHLSFGYGTHVCAGQNLARLQTYAVIDALARHVREFTVASSERRLNNMTRPYEHIEVTGVVTA